MPASIFRRFAHLGADAAGGRRLSDNTEDGEYGTGWPGWHLAWVVAVYLYMLPVVLPSLGCYFDPDDVSNLYYHRFHEAPFEAAVRSVLLFLPYRRPVGGCLYLLLYAIFGLTNPLP
jgi:hypothetical protein